MSFSKNQTTGKWLPFDLDGGPHKCSSAIAQPQAQSEKVTELIELVELEERMEHAATLCTEIRSKVSELELVVLGAGAGVRK